MLSAGLSCGSAGMGNAITAAINTVPMKSARVALTFFTFILASFDFII
jgi:hypothetical protein